MTPLERFEREYIEYHRISPDRRITQLRVLRQLEDHAGKKLVEVEPDDIKSFLSAATDRGLHVNTIRKFLHMVKPFYGWAWEANLIDAETFMQINRIHAPRGSSPIGLPRPYSRKDLEKFRAELAAHFPEVEEKFWKRWRNGTSRWKRVRWDAQRIQLEAIVALALHCGLRCQEIYGASVDDIHYDNEYVVVRYAKDHENGGKFREVPHTATSREAVRRWLELRTELGPKHDQVWLSLGVEENRLAPMRWDRFRRLLGTLGSGWEFHRFRHTYGTEMLRSTKRLEIVSRLLGHSRIQQTLGYAELVRDDLQQAVERAEASFMKAVA